MRVLLAERMASRFQLDQFVNCREIVLAGSELGEVASVNRLGEAGRRERFRQLAEDYLRLDQAAVFYGKRCAKPATWAKNGSRLWREVVGTGYARRQALRINKPMV